MTERVTFGDASGELVAPEGSAKAPAVVLVHEYWGVNAQIQSMAKRWADAGFLTLVPDLFHGKVAATAAEAQALMSALDFPRAVRELVAAVEYLKTHPRSTGKVAVTGYCLGGALTFLTACSARGLAAAVPFYGVPPQADWSKVEAPIQAHFAKHDNWASEAAAKAIQTTLAEHHKPMELFVYDAQHAFCNDRRPEVHDAAAASQAWNRTVAFVRQHTA